MNEAIEKVIDLVSDMKDIVDNELNVSVLVDGIGCTVFVTFPKDFLAWFKQYDINKHDGAKVYELTCEVDGIMFKTHMTEQEHLELIKA